jgi:hypothetical protein
MNSAFAPAADGKRWLVWAALFMTLWTAGLLWQVYAFLCDRDRTVFLEQTRRTAGHYAWLLADALSTEEPFLVQAHVRRLAGEEHARYAVLTDAEGNILASAGSPPGPPQADSLARRAGETEEFQVVEVDAAPPYLECAEPVWADGEKKGVLRWGVWLESLEEGRRAHRKRLAAAGAWSVGGGLCLASFLFIRRRRARES